MGPKSQLYFIHNESPEEIATALKKKGITVNSIWDDSARMVYPYEDYHDDHIAIDPKRGEFTETPLKFDFDYVIMVYTAPNSPDFEGVYYAKRT